MVMYDGDLPIHSTILSIPTVNGLVIVCSYSTDKAAGDSFYNTVQSSVGITAQAPKSNITTSGIAKIAGGLVSILIAISFARKRS